MTDHLDMTHAHMRAASTLLPTPGVHTSTNAAHTSAQCHLVFSLLGLDRLWGRAMPCRWPFDPGGAIRGGARGYCELKSDSPRTQTGHGPAPPAPKSRSWEN